MAEPKKTSSFPTIPTPHWWALRKKFKQSIPGVVTASYVAAVLNMQVNSAGANVLPALRATKIIDKDGKPLERAKRWRDDEQYPAVCEEIRHDIYPQELLDAIPNPATNRAAADRWFGNKTGAGAAAISKMSTFYTLLSDGDPKGQEEAASSSDKAKPKTASTTRPARAVKSAPVPTRDHELRAATDDKRTTDRVDRGPAVHINLQVHISPDASSDQIDQVFASMAKHLYKGVE